MSFRLRASWLVLSALLAGCDGGTFIFVPGPQQQFVSGFAQTANGNALPLRQLNAGARVQAIASDTLGELYVASDDAIRVYGRGANGNAAPIRVIYPADVAFSTEVRGLAIDVATNIYAPLRDSDEVVVFAGNANGSAAPFRSIRGPDTAIYHPNSIAIDNRLGTVYISNFGGFDQKVNAFGPGVTGNVAPQRTIIRQGVPIALAVDVESNLYIAENGDTAAPSSVSVFAPDAAGEAQPIRRISGPQTKIVFPGGLAIEPDGTLYVFDGITPAVNVFAPGANGDTPPIRVISLGAAGFRPGDHPSTLALTTE